MMILSNSCWTTEQFWRKRMHRDRKPVFCWFITTIEDLRNASIHKTVLCCIYFLKLISTNTKTNFLTRNRKKIKCWGQTFFYFECICHSISSLPLSASEPLTPASTSLAGAWKSEGSGSETSDCSSAASEWGDGVALSLTNSTWREATKGIRVRHLYEEHF